MSGSDRGPAGVTSREEDWRRLNVRMIWVDLAQSVLSLLPGVVAVFLVGVDPSLSAMWPLALVAGIGVTGAVADIVRWMFTRYRITHTDVERRTGVLVRRHRTIRRDRIRTVDTHAKLRHRIAGLRVVTIGAGQQAGAGESALFLDALAKDDAALLRGLLLGRSTAAELEEKERHVATARRGEQEPDAEVLATFRPWWVVYNMTGIGAYFMAAGLLWGLYWLASTFGIDLLDVATGVADRLALGVPGAVAVVLAVAGIVGALGLGVHFLTSYWSFELARVRVGGACQLRTRRGLFSNREVGRDVARMRGLSIGEPLLWRWMGMADTNVITTGLSQWDPQEPTAILPRGPVRVAREVATRVLGSPSPLDAPLAPHPRAALRRRMWWATLTAAVVVAVPVAAGSAPTWVLWAALALWPVGLLGAAIAYRALGHAIVDEYLVVRAGLLTRTTSALRRDAVSTIAVRQSLLQRRLGLSTVTAMTAAGWGAYDAPDIAAHQAVALAARAAPGVIDEFVVTEPERGGGW